MNKKERKSANVTLMNATILMERLTADPELKFTVSLILACATLWVIVYLRFVTGILPDG